jgi:hypothetical protein
MRLRDGEDEEDIQGEGGEKKGDMVHCLGKDHVGRIKKLN